MGTTSGYTLTTKGPYKIETDEDRTSRAKKKTANNRGAPDKNRAPTYLKVSGKVVALGPLTPVPTLFTRGALILTSAGYL